jgi:hypothetical protein
VAAARSNLARLLETLSRHRLRCIVVGGVAAVIEGAPVSTFDLDIVHDRKPDNIKRLSTALTALEAIYRGRRGTPLTPAADALGGDGHHLLITKFGPLDVLGAIGKDRDYSALLPQSKRRKLGTTFVRVLNLETQIAVKEELAYEKDRLVLPLLRETLRIRKR